MVLITEKNNVKYRELRQNEDPTLGEMKALIDEMGLVGTVKKNVGGFSKRTKSDIRAEILKAYPDPDRTPLHEVSANPRAPPPPPPPEFASPVATRRAAVPLRTPQQKLDDALEEEDAAAAAASLRVLSPSGFKGMKNKLNEVKKRFPKEAEGVKGLGAKGYTLADFGESLIKALEKAMRPSAPPGAEATRARVAEAPAPEAPRAAATPAAAPMEVELRAATEPAAPEAPRLAAMEVDAAPPRTEAPAAPPPSPEPDFFGAVSNLFGWLAPAATNWLGIPNSGVEVLMSQAPWVPTLPFGRRTISKGRSTKERLLSCG